MNKSIIALLGMPGSGKTEAIQYLMKKYKWPKVHFGQITFDEVARRGLPLTPHHERAVREELRKNFGKEHYAKMIVERIDAMTEDIVLVESLYSWTEYLFLKERYQGRMKTITIHASPAVRHARLSHRKHRPLTYEEARERDRTQIEILEQGGPIALSDGMIVNEGTPEELESALDALMREYGYDKAR